MSGKGLIILLVVAVAAVIATVAVYWEREETTDFESGMLLIQGLPTEKVHTIRIQRVQGAVTIRTTDEGRFLIDEKGDYPASAEKRADLLLKCLEIRCKDRISRTADSHRALGVAEDSEDAVVIRFNDEDGKTLVGFIKGKDTETGRGSYVRLLGDDSVYTTEQYLSVYANPTDYVDKQLVAVPKDDVERVEVAAGNGPPYVIEREEDGKIALRHIPEGKQAKGTAYERVFDALSGLNLIDLMRTDEKRDLAWDAVYTAHLKNGLSYTVHSARVDDGKEGEDGDKFYVRLSAASTVGGRITVRPGESDESLREKEARILGAEKAVKFTEQHAPWVYEVSSWGVRDLRQPLGNLLEDIPREEPAEIAARHILIAYKGAERSTAERTKEEAKTLAEEVLEKAKAADADFAALAREHSDGPSGSNGGDLGSFPKGQMSPAFETAAFALDIDGISSIVETPFGFHIIKRTR